MSNLRNSIREIAMTRPLIDMQVSMLLNIKSNLQNLISEGLEGIDPVHVEVFREVWRGEIREIELELIKRN